MRAMLFYALLPIIAYIGLRRPFWGLAIYLSANIIRPEMLFWGGHTGSLIFRVSIVSALIGFFFSNKSVTKPFATRDLWLILWLWLAVVASLLFADLPLAARAWYYSEEFLKLVLVSWLIIGLIKEKQEALRITNVLLIMASLLSLWGIEQSFRGNERLEGLGGSAFGDSNGVAAFGVLFFPLALHKFLTAQDYKQKLFGLISSMLVGGMIILTDSRGGFLGIAAGILYLLIITPKKKLLIATVVIILLLISPFIKAEYTKRLSSITVEQEQRDYSSASRLVLWRAGWLMFLDHPLFGVGLLNFASAKASYRDELSGRYDQALLDYSFQDNKVGHSTWFCQILAEGGLFLAIPFSWLILGFFWRARGLRKAQSPAENTRDLHNTLIGLEAGILGCCVSISFIDALISPFLPVQLLVGMQLVRIIEGTATPQGKTHAQGYAATP